MVKFKIAMRIAMCLLLCAANKAHADLLGDMVGDKASDNRDTRADALFNTSNNPPDYDDAIHKEDLLDMRRLKNQQKQDAQKQSQDSGGLYDRFDGSEFKKQSYIDSDFRRNPFRDLYKSNLTPPDQSDLRRRSDSKRDDDDKENDADDVEKTRKHLADRLRKKDMARDLRDWREVTKPIPYLLHDWVPASPDPIHNGGFVKMPDNGSPVPYRLNGHMDPERNLPWAKGD
ncbi:MAG: hypothetical protein IAF58_03960 [Leptolyngbya sp.]|nr:hypothetical protein [Candidatus Melainabacteria bacterium]